MSISNAVLECVRILTPTQTDKTLSSNLRQELADILVRLKIWAGNVGVFAPDNASVDYRLRDDEDLVEVVFSMMRKLKQSLYRAVHPPLLEESEDEGEEENEEAVTDPVSSGSSSASLDSDSSAEESDSGNDLEGLGPSAIFIAEANNVINRLYRLAAVFRKPVSSSENAKIRGFMKKQNEKGDVEELADVEDHARCHIKAHFPQAPEFLVSRLVEAAVFRRMKIRYRQHHQAKLNQGIEPVFAAPALYVPSDEGTETPVARATLSNLLSNKRDSIRGMSGPPPTPRSMAFSATIASSVNSVRLADYAKSSALSGITKAAVGRRQQLDVPPPPNNGGKDKVVCPYCLRLISQEEMRQPRWTRHILKDIGPFVCLFEECKESLTLFKTVEEWLGHMRWQHTIVYSCQAVGHEREVFGSSQDLEDHIRREHPGTFTESQLPSLVEHGAVPTSNTLGALNLSLSLDESQCLLCHTFDPKPMDTEAMDDAASGSTPEQTMQNHILEHLEAIALLALPGSSEPDGVDTDARQSSPGSDAEKKNEADDLPSAVFEDTVTETAVDESVPDQDEHDDFWATVFQKVKQSRLLEPHEDPILIELGETRQKNMNNEVAIGDVRATEETSLDQDANLDKKLGIKIVFQPEHKDDIDLDILAVHGFGADPETTWTYTSRDPQDKSKVTKKVTWLSDPTMLPMKFPNARIMTFGYESDWFDDSFATDRLNGIAATILEDLGRVRRDCDQRPILFICHCYGGLVMQQAYLTSERHASDYPGIYDAITGIIFLGTPHRGSRITEVRPMVKDYRSTSQQTWQIGQIEDIQALVRDDQILRDIVRGFTREVSQRTAPPEIFCFFEQRPADIGLEVGIEDYPRGFVADEYSSTLPGFENMGLALDHFSMIKFGSNEDYHYILVVNELVKMADKARGIMRKRGEALNKGSRQTTQQSHSATHRSVPMLPFPVSKGFAGRDGILEKIKAMFDHSTRVALVGPCGSGKTHVAEEYADAFLKENPEAKIFYVHASNAAEFQLSFDAIKDKMKLRQREQGDTMGAVRDFLNQGESGQWLIIIDGLDLAGETNRGDQPKEGGSTKDFDFLQWFVDYIPEGHVYGGNILVTMRSRSMAARVVNHKWVVDLPSKLSEEDVTILLCGDFDKDFSSTAYQMKISDLLQGSAGALALVRACKETSGADVSWKDLWERVQASSSKTNDSKNSSQTEERVKAAAGIWKPLYSQLRATNEEAARLLHVLSLLDVQSIPMFVIEGYFDNKSQQAEQIKALTDYGMLQLSVNRRDARVTPLVRLSANAMLDSHKLDDVSFLREAALTLVVIAYPLADERDNIRCKVLRPCALAALRLSSDSAELGYKRAKLLLRVAVYEKRVERYDTASEFLVQCLDLCKSMTKAPRQKKLQKRAKKLLEEAQKEQLQSWVTDSDSDHDGGNDDNTAEHEFAEGGSSGVERDNDDDHFKVQVSQEDLSSEEEDESDEDAVEQGS